MSIPYDNRYDHHLPSPNQVGVDSYGDNAEQNYDPTLNMDDEFFEPLPEVKVDQGGAAPRKKNNNNKQKLSGSDKRLNDRFEKQKKNLGNDLNKLQNKLNSLNKKGADVDAKISVLNEIEDLIKGLEGKDQQLEVLEDTLELAGVKNQANFSKKIEKLKQNVEKSIDSAFNQKNELKLAEQEEQAKAQEAENKARETAKAGAEKRNAAAQLRELKTFYLDREKYDTTKDRQMEGAKRLLLAMSNAVESGNWSIAESQIDSLALNDDAGEALSVVAQLILYAYKGAERTTLLNHIPPSFLEHMSEIMALDSDKNDKVVDSEYGDISRTINEFATALFDEASRQRTRRSMEAN